MVVGGADGGAVRPARRGQQRSAAASACAVPIGPGGEPVTDSFYFVHQPLAGNGSITVSVSALSEQHPRGPREPATGRRAVGEGRAHHQGEHPPGIAVRGDDGHRRPRRADAGQLHQRHGRPPRPASARVSPLAAAGPLGRHDHRLRLRRRHALDQGRHRARERARTDRTGRAVRRISACRAWHGHGTAACPRPPSRIFGTQGGWAGGDWTGDQVGAESPHLRRIPAEHVGFVHRIGRPLHRDRRRRHRARHSRHSADRWHPRRDPHRHVRRADRGDRRGGAVHHHRIPAEPDPRDPGRQPETRPGARGQGHRPGRRHLRRRAGGSGRRGSAR